MHLSLLKTRRIKSQLWCAAWLEGRHNAVEGNVKSDSGQERAKAVLHTLEASRITKELQMSKIDTFYRYYQTHSEQEIHPNALAIPFKNLRQGT